MMNKTFLRFKRCKPVMFSKNKRVGPEPEWKTEVMSLYYQDSSRSLEAIAAEYRMSFEECHSYFKSLSWVSHVFRKWPDEDPSPWLAGKVLARAREEKTRFFPLLGFLRPRAIRALAGALPVLLVGFIGFKIWQTEPKDPFVQVVASHQILTSSPEQEQDFPVPLRSYFRSGAGPGASTRLVPVSVGPAFADPDVDSKLDQKILARSSLIEHEVEALFFRARKLQQLGHYREAIRDYEFITKFYPRFQHVLTIPLALASCYEALDEKERAISVLQKFEKNHGDSDEIDLWIDELKSETF